MGQHGLHCERHACWVSQICRSLGLLTLQSVHARPECRWLSYFRQW